MWRAVLTSFAVAACGEVIDAPPLPVKVLVLTDDMGDLPDNTARVLFQDAAGGVIVDSVVDATGRAEAVVPAGGSITAIRTLMDSGTARSMRLTTMRAVQPGDDITIGFKAPNPIRNQGGETTMTATFMLVGDATSYQFFTECGVTTASASPVTLTFRDSCHGPKFDMFVTASGGTVSPPRFVLVSGITHQNGGAFTVPAIASTMSNFTVNVTNTPEPISRVAGMRASLLNETIVAEQSFMVADPGAGTVTAAIPFASGIGPRSAVRVDFERADIPGVRQEHGIRTPSLSNTIDVDYATHELPWFSSVMITPTGLAWTVAQPAGAPDGMLSVWRGAWMDNGVAIDIDWRIAQAFDSAATEVRLPSLPPAYASLDPATHTDVTLGFSGVLLVDYDIIAGYDEYRQMPETLSNQFNDVGGVGVAYSRRFLGHTAAGPMPPARRASLLR